MHRLVIGDLQESRSFRICMNIIEYSQVALALISLKPASLLMPMMFGHIEPSSIYRHSIEEVRGIQWNHS